MSYDILNKFLPAIQSLRLDQPYTKNNLLTDPFLLGKDGNLKMYYAPHNEYVNHKAKIVIVGITPGWQQMKTAFMQFIKSHSTNNSLKNSLYHAKIAARFSGAMRKNLCHMLDQCHIPHVLNIPNSSYLFEANNQLLHTTSIIKYPVFINNNNYTGYQPGIEHSPLLKHYAYHMFPMEINKIETPALVIPLGRLVDQTILKLAEMHKLPNHYYVSGFPHPSGANGHRIKQFKLEKQQIREKVRKWSNMLP